MKKKNIHHTVDMAKHNIYPPAGTVDEIITQYKHAETVIRSNFDLKKGAEVRFDTEEVEYYGETRIHLIAYFSALERDEDVAKRVKLEQESKERRLRAYEILKQEFEPELG